MCNCNNNGFSYCPTCGTKLKPTEEYKWKIGNATYKALFTSSQVNTMLHKCTVIAKRMKWQSLQAEFSDGVYYYYIGYEGRIIQEMAHHSSAIDYSLYLSGNFFKSKEAAQQAVDEGFE